LVQAYGIWKKYFLISFDQYFSQTFNDVTIVYR
jgi:hypothetical protein